jgi:uncharacterized protein
MIPRQAAPRILRLLQGFPVVTVTGPRQSGKTTLVKSLLPDRPYVSLESPADREFARSSPAEFLSQFPNGAVIDEAQNAPELFSQMQTVVDASAQMGRFVLTGSQNLSLLSHITQSLAGRTALVELLPLSVSELRAAGKLRQDFSHHLVNGFFPAVHSRKLDAYEWLQGYLITYAERDARQLSAIQDLSAFQRFLRLTAARTGQLLNMQSLASDVGMNEKTIRQWLSILETCYLIHFVRPHLANFGKRLVKAPKLYMTDVGLAASLLGIRTESQAHSHPLRGALFETMVINELLKNRLNAGIREPLWFWRDNSGTEVDVILERGAEIAAVEIKSGVSVAGDALSPMRLWKKYAEQRGSYTAIHLGMVYAGQQRYAREGVDILPWHQL